MNKKTLDNILNFRGDISSSFSFLMNVYDNLGFQLQTNLRGVSDPSGTFSNSIRSYRQKRLLHPVEKSGVRLVLNGRNLIQYLLIQRLLLLGANLKDLQEVILNLPDNELHRLILADTLTLNDLPINKSKSSPTVHSRKPEGTIDSSLPVYYSVRLSDGIQLHIDGRKYNEGQVEQIKKVLKTALNDR